MEHRFFPTLLLIVAGTFAAALAPHRGWSASPSAEITIDRVEISGAGALPRAEIESALELGPGDRLERVKVVRTAENLQALYHSKGYEQVSIKSRLLRQKGADGRLESILDLAIAEGLPTRVTSLQFVPENLRDEAFQRYWKKIQNRLTVGAAIKPGDLFDQTRVAASKRTLQDQLASEEFIGARVDDIRISDAPPPKGSASLPAGRWVALEYHVDLGDRVTFGFRGNTVFPSYRLATVVEEQRLIGFGKDYINAIRLSIEDLYRALGYARIKIDTFTFEKPHAQERHITYVVTEGPRITIDSIDFDGNLVFNKEQLREEFFRKAPLQVQLGYYVASDVTRAAELMVEWLKSKGYLAAKLVTINTAAGTKNSTRLTIYLYEGDQTIVHGIGFKGSAVFTDDELRSHLGVGDGLPLNLYAFTEGMESLKAAYRAKGYLDIAVTNEVSNEVIRYSQENRLAEIQLALSEGPQYRASRILIEGYGTTKEDVIRRELTISEGDILTEPAIVESEARLRRLGIFSIVAVRTLPDAEDPAKKIVRVSVQEGTPGILAGGTGFRNDQGVRVFGQIGYANLWGLNHSLTLGVTANRRLEDFRFIEGQAQLAYLWPWFMKDDLTFRPAFTVSSAQYLKFSARSTAFSATFERRILRRPNMTGLLTYNLEQIKQFNSVEDLDNQDLKIGSIVPALQLDMRDNPLAPSKGIFAASSFELAAPLLLSQTDPFPVGYTRFQFRSDAYIPLSPHITWFVSFRTGIERNTEEEIPGILRSGAIPSIKTFTLGGPSSLRGFKEQALNKYDYKILGTLSYVNYRTQLDLPLSGSLRFGPFLDAANLLIDRYSFGQLRFGSGVGFHYQTPVGPVNLDWGFNLDPQPGEDYWRFHFSIGVI